MVRPHHFRSNVLDCADNHYMSLPGSSGRELAAAAFAETTAMVDALRARGVTVHVVEDETDETPDSVFPNNWFSTHADGSLALYPMRAESRRAERRPEVLELLARDHVVTRHLDHTPWEDRGHYLEGTGAMVLDHVARVAYACRSHRMSDAVLTEVTRELGLRPVTFDALDDLGSPIYHTNVVMAVGSDLALVGLETFATDADRDLVRGELEAAGCTVVPLTRAQVGEFAGNALEVSAAGDPLWVMSARGWAALDATQRATIEAAAGVLPVTIPTIEHAGGSARCMLAGIHLPLRATGVPA